MYPPHHYGGYELSCRDVVERWRRRGHQVSVLTGDLRLPGVEEPPDERAAGVCDDWLSYTARIDPWMHLFVDRLRLGRVVQALTGLPSTAPDLGSSGTFCFVSRLTEERSLAHTSWTFPVSTVTYSGIDLA